MKNLTIDKFLGLHSDALGDTELKLGELSYMQNFKITKNYNAEKRNGYVAQLTEYAAENEVTNSGFATNTTGWDISTCTASVTGGIATVRTTSQYGGIKQIGDYVAGHKYYGRALVKADTTSVRFSIMRTGGYDQLFKAHSGSGNYESLSGIVTLNSPVSSPFIQMTDTRASGWTDVLIDYIFVLDLTATFGAGNEPDIEWCDANITYFDGASTIDYNSNIYLGAAIQGQWYGVLNGSLTHLFASNGHIYKNNGDGSTTDLGTLTDAPTNFFQFEDTQGITQLLNDSDVKIGSTSNVKLGQTFTPTRPLKLTSVSIALGKVYGTGGSRTDNVTCKIYSTSAGLPSVLLATATNYVAHSAISTTKYSIFEYYFEEITLSDQVQYAIVIEATGSVSSANYYIVASTSSSTYSGGNLLNYISSWSADTNKDIFFKVNAKPEYSVYIMNGHEYKKWTGYGNISDVVGYYPIIQTGTSPASGVGVINESLNYLSGKRRVLFNGDGSALYKLPEKSLDSIDAVYVNGIGYSLYTPDVLAGTVEFPYDDSPEVGIDNVEIVYTKGTGQRSEITKRTHSEKFGGKNDSRIFIYGNDSSMNYSGLADGVPSAEYFPVLNYIRVGSNEYNITSLVKQYDRLIIFKEDTTWWSSYDYDTTLGANFPVYPLNDSIGCTIKGSGRLVQNNPYVIFKNQIYQFVSSNVRDERNATLMSMRVQPFLDELDMSNALTFDNEEDGELWIIIGKKCYIYNYFLDVWYYYIFNDTVTSIIRTDEVTLGTSTGQIMKFADVMTDNGVATSAALTTGYINYGTITQRKFVNFAWLQLYLDGTPSRADFYFQTDKDPSTLVKVLQFTTETSPKAIRLKPKMKKFVVCKFSVRNPSLTEKCRILSISAPAIIGGISK